MVEGEPPACVCLGAPCGGGMPPEAALAAPRKAVMRELHIEGLANSIPSFLPPSFQTGLSPSQAMSGQLHICLRHLASWPPESPSVSLPGEAAEVPERTGGWGGGRQTPATWKLQFF